MRFDRFALPRAYIWLALIVLAFRVLTALPIEHAGYMDASYTVHVAEQLAQGRGFTEEVLWNYLDEPTALPHPSNLYWLPLPAILAAGSFLVFGISYHAAQVPFILLSVIPPLFAFYLARRIFKRDDYAWTAGLLTTFSGFYTVYWVAADNFAPFAVTTDVALLCMALALEGRRGAWFLAGLGVGLSQLARTDGLLLLAVVPLALLISSRSLAETIRGTLLAAAGAVLVLAPWLARNYLVAGSLLGPGGTHTLFLTSYEELFRYNVGDLTLGHYLAWGWGNILSSKLAALGFDSAVVLLGAMQIFLAPFALIGFWQMRHRAEFTTLLIYLGLLLAAMVLVFTFPSQHGSMLHSSIALVAFCSVAVPPGLDSTIRWVALRRHSWNAHTAQVFFRAGFVILAVGLAVFTYSQGVLFDPFGATASAPLWNQRDSEYSAVGAALAARGVSPLQPVLTVDPPSFHNETGRRSIYLPTDNAGAIMQVARQFDAHYLVLENDRPGYLDDLYAGRAAVKGLDQVATFKDAIGRPVVLYQIEVTR